MKVGVLDVQGDVTEHVLALKAASKSSGIPADVVTVKTPHDVRKLSALVIPGGESTTVSQLMRRFKIDEAISEVASDIPVFGTCAGMVLLSKEGANMKKGQSTLSLMDAKVIRNAFGSQKDSFECELKIPVLGAKEYPAVFIRAPAIEKVWGQCKSLCKLDGRIVFARQDNLLASAFHPELTEDLRVHEYFLGMI